MLIKNDTIKLFDNYIQRKLLNVGYEIKVLRSAFDKPSLQNTYHIEIKFADGFKHKCWLLESQLESRA